MACPICDHTMQNISPGSSYSNNVFHCSRCGTLKYGEFIEPTSIVRYAKEMSAEEFYNFLKTDILKEN